MLAYKLLRICFLRTFYHSYYLGQDGEAGLGAGPLSAGNCIAVVPMCILCASTHADSVSQ
jgi:hypothetical protein